MIVSPTIVTNQVNISVPAADEKLLYTYKVVDASGRIVLQDQIEGAELKNSIWFGCWVTLYRNLYCIAFYFRRRGRERKIYSKLIFVFAYYKK